MKNQNEQLNLFTEEDSNSRCIEQGKLREAKAKLEKVLAGVSCIGNDCFYYLAAGACILHDNAIGCSDCNDYRPIDDSDIEEDEDDE